ncbi:MAG: TetR/AcrR family transcriptional regulator [Myxococcota bacterium]
MLTHHHMIRREPVQARSRARVDTILDAADAVFLERGYAAATTNHVAAAAGTSIGSLYRFFPDKEALLVALAKRYGDQLLRIAREVTPADPRGHTVAGMVALGIDTFNRFLQLYPGFRTIVEQAGHPALREGAAAHTAAMVAIIGGAQGRVAPRLSPEELAVVTEVTHAVLGTLQVLSVTRDDDFRVRVVSEAKILVTGYLARRLGVDEDAPIGG